MALKGDVKINVLGTEYTIHYQSRKDNKGFKDCDGYTDVYSREIFVVNHIPEAENNCKNLDEYYKKVTRHEIIHAFAYESGLQCNSHNVEQWAQDEEMTDWIAIQFPKMLEVFSRLDVI